MKILYVVCVTALSLLTLSAVGQSQETVEIQRQLLDEFTDLKSEDVQNLLITSEFVSDHNGVKHIYLQQTLNGIKVKNSSINATFNGDGELINLATDLYTNLSSKADQGSPTFDLSAVLDRAISDLGIQANISINELEENRYEVIVDSDNYHHTTKAELVYWSTPEDELKLAWEFDLDLTDESHWWQYISSAVDGNTITRFDLQLSCTSYNHESGNCAHFEMDHKLDMTTFDGSSYRVFPFPIESPNHGDRDLLIEPADPAASPFGWHDTDGFNGHEFTITRGNNVYAYEDAIDADFPGFSPDGGDELDFDHPLDFGLQPTAYQEASITNLFYANNRIHDLLYAYGFTEAAGNFQENNYFNGGLGSDPVNAEAQDGEGFNNANMATPEEGDNPRMQMYLWTTGQSASNFEVNSPESIAGSYLATGAAAFGPAFPAGGLTGDLAIAEDGEGSSSDICTEVINPADLDGKIALIRRGGCTFVEKVLNAQEAGAIGVVVYNNIVGGGVDEMGGASTEVTIPSLMVSFETGQLLLDALEGGDDINVTAQVTSTSTNDGSFDNGIIVHEYVHGLTNRLTGGAFNVFCLFNEEQMGEGWSDWYALMFTMDLDVENPVYRPMGTFASGEPTDGIGIRVVPYDTSFAVNDFTYEDLPNQILSVPHGVGFVWSTMLWDLTWAFIDEYGYDPDLINGDAGNNRVLRLVTDALTLQACTPGFVDGRDAILLADELLYDGANQCLIWEVFARRGLGFSADQGSSASRSDGTAAFDLPPICQEVFNPPNAAFSTDSEVTCSGTVQFTDESTDIPQEWLWDFGDGNTSEEQNPVHTYDDEGTYTVTLTVSNTLGEDQAVQSDLIVFEVPDDPTAEGASGCAGEEVVLSAESPDGNDIRWLDANLQEIGLGNEITVTLGSQAESYYAQNYSELPGIQFVGPEDNDIGLGENHATGFVGTVDFTTSAPITIESALVYSGATGNRTINLYPNAGGVGIPIESVTVNVDFIGGDRIDLGFTINEPGNYSIGLNQANFYRNESGADYPYTDDSGTFSIIGSSAGPDYYYYFYDLEVIAGGCLSSPVEVTTEVTGEAAFSYEDNGLEVSFTDESPEATSWEWDFGDGNTSNEQNPVHLYDEMGTYTVTLTVDDGCSITFEVSVGITDVSDASDDSGFSIYPNPTGGLFFVDNESDAKGTLTLAVLDITGKRVYAEVLAGRRTEIDLTYLSSGVYFVSVRSEDDILHRSRLTITE